jgi:hypothetical protein
LSARRSPPIQQASQAVSVIVAGVNAHAWDICLAVLTLAAVIEALQMPKSSAFHFLWIVFGASVLFSWARRIDDFGLNQATNSLRSFCYLWSPELTFLLSRRAPSHSIGSFAGGP